MTESILPTLFNIHKQRQHIRQNKAKEMWSKLHRPRALSYGADNILTYLSATIKCIEIDIHGFMSRNEKNILFRKIDAVYLSPYFHTKDGL